MRTPIERMAQTRAMRVTGILAASRCFPQTCFKKRPSHDSQPIFHPPRRTLPPRGWRHRCLPAVWSAAPAVGRLASCAGDEKILAWLEIDLDARLRFAAGMVVVTSERLLAMSADDSSGRAGTTGQDWR